MIRFNPFASAAKPAAPQAASQLEDQRSLTDFEKLVLGKPLSLALQDELKRTIAIRNLPSGTTEASIRRTLESIPGGIKNVALFLEPPQHRAALVEFSSPNGPNAHEHLAKLGEISPFIMVTIPKVVITQVKDIRNPPPPPVDPFTGPVSSFFAPLVNLAGLAYSSAPAPPPAAAPDPLLIPISNSPAAASPASSGGVDLRARVAELEAEVQRLTKLLAEAQDQNDTLILLLQENSPELAANFRKSSSSAKPPAVIPKQSPPPPVVAAHKPSPPPAAAARNAAPKVRVSFVRCWRQGTYEMQMRSLNLSAGEMESRRLMLSMKAFDQWRRWAHQKGRARKENMLTEKLLKEEALAKQRELERKKYNCPICFSEITVSDLYLVDECNHRFCKDCLQGYLNTKINDGQTMEITCPVPKCPTKMNDREIKNLVNAKTYEKFEKFRLDRGLSLMDDVRFCPKAGCGVAMIGDPESPMMVCQACRYSYCFNCKEEWHADTTCEKYQRWKTENKSADSKYQEWVARHAKQCPKCKTIIEKNGGCNHMTCGKCKHQFCWLCMKNYSSGHFGNMPWSCKQYS